MRLIDIPYIDLNTGRAKHALINPDLVDVAYETDPVIEKHTNRVTPVTMLTLRNGFGFNVPYSIEELALLLSGQQSVEKHGNAEAATQ